MLALSPFVPLLPFFTEPFKDVVADFTFPVVDLDVDFPEDACCTASLHPLFVPPAAEFFCLSFAFSLKNLNSLGFGLGIKADGDRAPL